MRTVAHILLAALLGMTMLAACNDGSCDEGRSAIPKATLYGTEGTTAVSIKNLAVYAIGAPGDTLIVDTATVSEFYLPLRPSAEQTRFVLDYTDVKDLRDTITINYQSKPFFVSKECGVMYFFTITDYSTTNHMITSVEISDPVITNMDRTAVRIRVNVLLEDESEEENG